MELNDQGFIPWHVRLLLHTSVNKHKIRYKHGPTNKCSIHPHGPVIGLMGSLL
jgi:hypothetical protein